MDGLTRRLREPRVSLGLVALLGVLYGLAALFDWGGDSATAGVAGWGAILASGTAAVSLLYAARRARRQGDERRGRAWFSFGLAATAWWVGELVHGVLLLFMGREGFPLTLADMFSLVALPPLVAGFALLARLPRDTRSWLRGGLDVWVCAASVFAVAWVVLFAPLYRALGQSPGGFLVDLTYPIVDVITVCLAGAFLLAVSPRDRRSAAVAYLAVVGVAAADFAYTVLRLRGAFLSGGPVDIVWFVSYLLLAAVPWLVAGTATSRAADAEPARDPAYRRWVTLVPPAVSVAVIVILVVAALAAPRAADPVLSLLAGSVGVALLVRLAGVRTENFALRSSLASEEHRFQSLAESIGDAVMVCDLEGRVRYLSQAVEQMYGCPPGQLIGRTLDDYVHPEDLPRVRTTVRGFLAEGPADDSVRVRCRVRGSDGTWRHIEAMVTRHVGPDGTHGLLFAARDVTEQVALQDQLTHLTFHDGLTGLPNRAYFEERTREVLARPRRGAADVAVLFLDLDGFTAVNDSVGHAGGDLLLAQAARRLRVGVQADDTVARFGADEFAVLVERRGEAQAVVDLAERLVGTLSDEPYHVAGREIVLTASVGVAFAEENLGATDLLRNADLARATAKDLGGGRLEIFARHMHAEVVHRLELRTDLRRALEEKQFAVEYQPVVDLHTSRVTGVEALVRWWRGSVLVPPEDFIAPAEELGLMVPLGQWVLGEACRQVAHWRASSWEIGLSVNLSVKQIIAPHFIESVAEALDGSGLPPSALTLEVTEEVLVDDVGNTIERLSELRKLGVRLAIDDFGTGYASLAYLRQLPVDIIKIDPSFVSGVGRDENLTLLTRTIVQLGRQLGLTVVAEGIERPEQLELLREMGCARGQGYLVARPMAARGVESVLRTSVSPPAGFTLPLSG
ncbi:MAG: EAL domain-containing protein [Streptosporangiales bacterium]|nr:EAL domain-containing protein [Streptosporangiales bacterium]